MDLRDAKLQLTYPCPWEYTLVGACAGDIAEAVREVVGGAAHTLRASHTSRTGRYVSFHLEVLVADEPHRNALHAALRRHRHIRMVL